VNNSTNNSPSLDFSGTLSAINQALASLSMTPAPEFEGPTTITFTTNDHGSIGVGPAPTYALAPQPMSSVPEVVNLTITDVVDAPLLDPTRALSFAGILEDTPATLLPGSTVLSMLTSAGGNAITLLAPGAKYGIAVTGLTQTNRGDWQFKIGSG